MGKKIPGLIPPAWMMDAAVTSFSSQPKIHFLLICCPRTDDTFATYWQTACSDGGRLTFATEGVAYEDLPGVLAFY